jgi:purine-binding chemotaxis protein CheW
MKEAQELQRRALALARPLLAARESDTTGVLTFSLAREQFAVETRFVVSAFRLSELTPLPGAQPPVRGLTGWRGDVLTVLDLRALVHSSATALDDLARVIVIGHERPEFGVLADVLGDVRDLVATDVLPPSADDHAASTGLVRGITRDGMRILDAAWLLKRYAATP